MKYTDLNDQRAKELREKELELEDKIQDLENKRKNDPNNLKIEEMLNSTWEELKKLKSDNSKFFL